MIEKVFMCVCLCVTERERREREREREESQTEEIAKINKLFLKIFIFYLFTPQWMSTTQETVMKTEVTVYAVKPNKEMVQEQVLYTAIRLKQNVTYLNSVVAKMIMVVL